MSIDRNHPDYLELRSRIRENSKDFVAIIGAGISRPCGLPSWTELRDHLVKNARDRESNVPPEERQGYRARLQRISENPKLWDCFSELKSILSQQAFEQCIKDRLIVKDKDTIPHSYDLLWQLNIKGIITYNLDTCAIDSYSRVRQYAVDTATGRDVARFPQFLVGPDNFVFQPHGHVSDPSTWVFTNSDKKNLLSIKAYIDFMTSLCQTKHLLILGFDPDDFAFQYLIQTALTGPSNFGAKHYIMLPRIDPGFIRKYGDMGFAVVPYQPCDPLLHPEIEATLKDFLEFTPIDDIPATVFTGGTTDLSVLPVDDELIRMPVHMARELLNRAVASIIPPNSNPQLGDIDKLEQFYHEHLKAIHMAWLIQPDSDFNIVHGYKAINLKGRGAFGQVYEVEQIDSHERAALKVLLPEVRSNREYLNSFRRGVRSMRILKDRNVNKMVKLIDAFEVPACVLMEFIDGPTLTEAQDWGLLDSLPQCLDVLIQIGEVVHTAHNLEERVLHRDLKPDNIILRNGYNKGEPLDVVVLDFDLSWHKGASDLSVVHGARAQGYAAPEQTATAMKPGMSTRHTAVDVFGYGMLAFFTLVGTDPRPNEQNFTGFKERLRETIVKRFTPIWHCLPAFLAKTIGECTLDHQPDRMPFSSAIEAFREAKNMALNDQIISNSQLILMEIAARVFPEAAPESSDFGRHLIAKGIDQSKEIDLKLESQEGNVVVFIELNKIRAEGEHRNVAKYLAKANDRAVAKLNVGIFNHVAGKIGQSRHSVYAHWPLKMMVARSDIIEVSNRITDALICMQLE